MTARSLGAPTGPSGEGQPVRWVYAGVTHGSWLLDAAGYTPGEVLHPKTAIPSNGELAALASSRGYRFDDGTIEAARIATSRATRP